MNDGIRELIRPLAVVGVALTGMLGVEGWSRYFPESGIFAVVGMRGTRANEGRTCEKVRWMSYRGPRRVRDVRCRSSDVGRDDRGGDSVAGAPLRVTSTYDLAYHRADEVNMRFWSRKPYMASVRRRWRDSTSYAAAVDSMHRALASHGATQVDCPSSMLHRVTGHLFTERWRDRGFEMSIQGIRMERIDGIVDYNLTVTAALRAYRC